jgi:hypothetical protein
MSTIADYVLLLDTVLALIGIGLAIAVASTRAPWVLPAGGAGILVVATLLILHRHRRRSEYARLRAARAARRQSRVGRGA